MFKTDLSQVKLNSMTSRCTLRWKMSIPVTDRERKRHRNSPTSGKRAPRANVYTTCLSTINEVGWRVNTWGCTTRVFRRTRHKIGGYGRPSACRHLVDKQLRWNPQIRRQIRIPRFRGPIRSTRSVRPSLLSFSPFRQIPRGLSAGCISQTRNLLNDKSRTINGWCHWWYFFSRRRSGYSWLPKIPTMKYTKLQDVMIIIISQAVYDAQRIYWLQ